MVGQLAGAMIFICLLVGLIIVGAAVAIYAGYCLLVVVRDTAAGNEAVHWSRDPFTDMARDGMVVVAAAALALAPAGLLTRWFSAVWLPDQPGLLSLSLAVPALCMFFPPIFLYLLSVGPNEGRWRPARPAQFLRLIPAVLTVYVASVILLALVGAAWFLALQRGVVMFLIAAGGGAAVLLIYGRLLGRLAWLVNQLEWKRQRPTPRVRKPRRRGKVQVTDPWADPPEPEEPPPRLPVEGYALAPEGLLPEIEEPPPKWVLEQPYEVQTEATASIGTPDATVKPSAAAAFERSLYERTDRDPPPRWPLISGVYTFPWYPTSLRAWLGLTIGNMALAGIFRVMGVFFPS
jgi:hypothetical protein